MAVDSPPLSFHSVDADGGAEDDAEHEVNAGDEEEDIDGHK